MLGGAAMTEHDALQRAIVQARSSPCQKSKRGVVMWDPRTHWGITLAAGYNHMTHAACDGSKACNAVCSKRCVHAEQAALLKAGRRARGAEMLHVKVVDGRAVTSKEPRCVDCSKLILFAEVAGMWLLVDVDGVRTLKRWTALEFHRETLINCGISP